jgi:hypothetical protein
VDAGHLAEGRRGVPGGIVKAAPIKVAALIQALGMDGMRFLRARPPDSIIYQALAMATDEATVKLQKRQAEFIAASVSKLFKK